MAIYYIDSAAGSDRNDGLSPETPKRNDTAVTPAPGDSILYRRGRIIRGILHTTAGTDDAPITYGAYGSCDDDGFGDKPIICGSLDASSPDVWEEIAPHIWRCSVPTKGDVGNIIFVKKTDDNRPWRELQEYEKNARLDGATLRWNREDLREQGDFWDSRFGETNHPKDIPTAQELLLYSVGNPASVYAHIELAHWGERKLGELRSNIIIEDIAFCGSGVHALAGSDGKNVTVRRCSFKMIGGCVWSRDIFVRFGNAVEFWINADHVYVEDNDFYGIYDSCVTHQGPGEKTIPANHFICRRNVFNTYGMAAFEYRDKMTIESEFTDNICINAGCGFPIYGETLPRRSEIWPQPMGHHIFLWRIEHATKGGSLVIARNAFESAPIGAAIYSIISPEAEAQMHVFDNTYDTDNPALLCHVGAITYKDYHTYVLATGWETDDDI
ncbi:MAG: hypothetical protein ACI3XM_03195 [Eubacteriales bacterium]